MRQTSHFGSSRCRSEIGALCAWGSFGDFSARMQCRRFRAWRRRPQCAEVANERPHTLLIEFRRYRRRHVHQRHMHITQMYFSVIYSRPLKLALPQVIEAKYKFAVDQKCLMNALNYRRSKMYPVQRDAAALIENLRKIKREHPVTYCDIEIDRDNRLRNVCFALPMWKEDFLVNGVVPGVSIDAKALACSYDIPLVTINGRDDGKTLTFFMGYIAAETEPNFVWFLERFKMCYNIYPKFVCLDQDMACINAVKAILPNSLILLDQYHLNVNQLKNCMRMKDQNSYRIPDSIPETTANQELHDVRNSPTEEIFLQRRTDFENKYFSNFSGRGMKVDGKLFPKWFFSLYYSMKHMVIACYTRKNAGLRFFFQGSGYSEASNASYRRKSMDFRVPFSQAPVYMMKISISKWTRRNQTRGKIKSPHKAVSSTVFIDGLEDFDNKCTSYGVERFLEKSLLRSQVYDIEGYLLCGAPSTMCGEDNLPSVRFFLKKRSSPSPHAQAVDIRPVHEGGKLILRAFCECIDGRTSGMPCRHITKLFLVYQGGTSFPDETWAFLNIPQGTLLSISNLVHCYWMWNTTDWCKYMPSCFIQPDNDIRCRDDSEDVGADGIIEGIKFEVQRQISTANTLSLYKRRAGSLGQSGLREFERIMEEALSRLGGDYRNHQLDNQVLSDQSGPIRNPNQGNPKRRGKRSRHRSVTEKFPLKKERN